MFKSFSIVFRVFGIALLVGAAAVLSFLFAPQAGDVTILRWVVGVLLTGAGIASIGMSSFVLDAGGFDFFGAVRSQRGTVLALAVAGLAFAFVSFTQTGAAVPWLPPVWAWGSTIVLCVVAFSCGMFFILSRIMFGGNDDGLRAPTRRPDLRAGTIRGYRGTRPR